MLQGQITEGNNAPLFYLIQKELSQLINYRYPYSWQGEWYVQEPRSQIVLRLISNISLSLSAAFIFYFFARQYSFVVGVYGLFSFLANMSVWLFWSEARPYALWIFLSTLQGLIFLKLIYSPSPNPSPEGRGSTCVLLSQEKEEALVLPLPRGEEIGEGKNLSAFRWLCAVHLGLAFTTSLSVIQIILVSVLIGFACKLKPTFLNYGFLTFLPLSIGIFYFTQAPHYSFRCPQSFGQLIEPCLSGEQGIVLGSYFLLLVGIYLGQTFWAQSSRRWPPEGLLFFCFLGLMLMAAGVLVVFYKATEPYGNRQFEFLTRYLLFLTPVGILAQTLACAQAFKMLERKPFWRLNLVLGLAGILAIGFLKSDPLWLWVVYLKNSLSL